MDPQTTLLVLLALATIAFFVFTYFAAKTWTITHVIMTVFVYFAAVFFAWMAAATLKTHHVWKTNAQDFEKKIAQVELERLWLKEGIGRNQAGELKTIDQAEDPVMAAKKSERYLDFELAKQIADRGRVWRNCQPAGGGAGGFTLTTTAPSDPAAPPVDPMAPPADPMAPAPAPVAAGPNLLKAKMLLYAFREADSAAKPDGRVYKLPAAYLGEFEVTAATDTSVTLRPTSNDPTLAAQLRVAGNWTLYETMPGDRYDALANAIPPGTTAADAETVLKQWLPKGANVDDALYQKVISEYAKHLTKTKPDASDPPENVWIKVKFLKPYKLKVDDDADTKGVEAYYQASGLSLPIILRRSGPVDPMAPPDPNRGVIDIEVGQEKELEQTKARELEAQGIVKEVEPVFIRRLRDYAMLFRQIDMARKKNNDEKSVVVRDTGTTNVSASKIELEVKYRRIEVAKLEEDKTKVVAEKQAIDEYYAKLMAIRTKLAAERAAASNNILQMGQKLAMLQKEMADRIDEQTRQASTTPAASPVPRTP